MQLSAAQAEEEPRQEKDGNDGKSQVWAQQ